MADRYLTARVAAGGVDPEEAAAQVDRVLDAIRAQLVDGRSVRLTGLGQLHAPRKRVFVPGSRNRQAREQRKVSLRYPEIIEKGEEYDV